MQGETKRRIAKQVEFPADHEQFTTHEQRAIRTALKALERILKASEISLDKPEAVETYLKIQIGTRHQEVFGMLMLDSQNRLIVYEEMFTGTINQTAVYPRELIRRALEVNAAAVILFHNHPSGQVEPSLADSNLTEIIKTSFAAIGVSVLDHIIVGSNRSYSFAQRGRI